VSFAAITLCVASQRVFVVVVDFVIDSVRKLLDTPSYYSLDSTRSPSNRALIIGRSCRGLGIFLFTTVSRMGLGPTHSPIQWVPRALSLGAKRPGR
jgi:hypothetical protein